MSISSKTRVNPAFLSLRAIPWTPRSTAVSACPRSAPVCTQADPSVAFVLSHFEARAILELRTHAAERPAVVNGPFSIDAGMRTLKSLVILDTGIALQNSSATPSPLIATWSELKKMGKKGRCGAFECFLDGESVPAKIAGISATTERTASLLPCVPGKPPTMVLAGFGMHRLKDTDPGADTEEKIRAIGSSHLHGRVLDVCTGLGYTAIAAANAAKVTCVTTVELDPVVVSIQRRNPWSQALFTNNKISRVEGDAAQWICGVPDGDFDVVIHDPPAQAMGGELYSLEFYRQLARVCSRGARLFHYIGDPSSTESGRLYRGVISRLTEAGFGDVMRDAGAYGVVARAR